VQKNSKKDTPQEKNISLVLNSNVVVDNNENVIPNEINLQLENDNEEQANSTEDN
jgi:hypothetical protein